jgi:hypothetical protein
MDYHLLRLATETGYWLIAHPDHARLAGAFATRWGNELFAKPRPRASVLYGIHVHDDGWTTRDASPAITRAGKPSAFSHELVGKYSAFEEIDLADYLAVRERAVGEIEAKDAYAAWLVTMHTINLLSDHADRSTIVPSQLPLLDAFLDRQQARQHRLRNSFEGDPQYTSEDIRDEVVVNNFRLLQACDNLSLLSCVAYRQPATLLHPLLTNDGGTRTVAVEAIAPRHFRLDPYPFDEQDLTFEVPARHVEGHIFPSAAELQQKLAAAKVEGLTVSVSR